VDPAVSIIRSRRVYNISTIELSLNRFAPQLQVTEATVTVLPKRVIDVGERNDEFVTLRDFGTTPPTGHYICLSHRWQRSCPSTTTLSNVEARKFGILMTDLSATLRDAILLTRALGIRYLWIDSLCILQDSGKDWEIESSKMGAYYGRSWLTIAAALDSESNPDHGDFWHTSSIFGPRYKDCTRAGYYRLGVSESTIWSSYLYFNMQDELSHDNRGSSYLFSRGWTLQEEALPSRFLSFQPRQTSLRIGDKIYHESGFTQQVSETSFITTDGTNKTWVGLIEDYTKRSLTNEGDKLSALSGIAQLYYSRCKDKYLGGLWQVCLLEHLCWCVPSTATKTSRPSAYRAPTWSWASIDGQVTFDRLASWHREIKIIEATTTPAGEDPFGQLQDGSITLEARLSKQHWRRDSGWKRKWYYAGLYDGYASSTDAEFTPFSNATLLLDVQDLTIDELELWSLPIHNQFALALQAIDSGEQSFRRIGAICWRSQQDDVNMSKPTIIIIR
jgi:Heterokaryon incompatibility protein (HET)